MNRNSRSLSENKLDDEFPPLSSLSKPTSNVQFSSNVLQQPGSLNSPLAKSSSAGIYSPKKQKAAISLSTAEQFAAFDIKGSESFLQTEFSAQDFNHALSSSFNYIPDTPYDVHESDLYSQTGINTGYANSNTDLQSTENLQIHYPTSRNMKLLQPESLRKYDLSTLFFIFFFFPGTPQQYFAGQELKSRDWIYNTKFQTWFHRISEPTEKTSSYEVAKFEYFDHSESSWVIRESQSFKFEYDQLCE